MLQLERARPTTLSRRAVICGITRPRVSIGGNVYGWSDGLSNALTLEPTWFDSLVRNPPSRTESADARIIADKGFLDLGGFGEMSLNVGVEGVQ